MTEGNSVFQLKEGANWSRGPGNLLDVALGRWFSTRRWWVQILIWAAIVNLTLFFVAINEESGGSAELASLFNMFLGFLAAIGVCIPMQGSIVGEKQSGTAIWVLSKLISRPAFILAKLVANTVGVALTIVLAQGLIAYLIIYLGSGTALSPLGFLSALSVQLIQLFFYITLTLMLGAAFNKRGPVIAIPFVFLFAQQMLMDSPALRDMLPWILFAPLEDYPSVAAAFITASEPLPNCNSLNQPL